MFFARVTFDPKTGAPSGADVFQVRVGTEEVVRLTHRECTPNPGVAVAAGRVVVTAAGRQGNQSRVDRRFRVVSQSRPLTPSRTMRLLSPALATLALAAPAAAAKPPNVVIVLADDMGWGDLAANGSNKVVKTPHLDAMAAAGVRFTRFYSASPLCSPTRAGLMSGRHPSRYACFMPSDDLPAAEVTLAELLRPAGYATGHFGKWHLGALGATSPTGPGGQGFDTSFSVYNSYQVPKMNVGFSRDGARNERTTGYCEDVIMDEALKFVRGAAGRQKPFLAVVCNMAPHSPFEAPDRLRALYPDEPAERQHYWGMISSIDENVGRLRKELRDLKVADDTLVVVTSDNGATKYSRTHDPFGGGKGGISEGGLRVPGVVEWPARVKKPFVSDVPAFTCDLLPTALAAAGVELPKGNRPLDGIDLLPVLDGKATERPRPLVLHFDDQGKPPAKGSEVGKVGFAVVDGRWKLLTDRAAKEVRLYDVAADPAEAKDVAAANPEVVARLRGARDAWWESVRAEPGFSPTRLPKKK